MAIAFVREASGTAATSTTLAVTITASTAGNFLVAVISNASGATNPVTGVTDSAGNTWSLAIAGLLSGSNTRCEIWYTANAASATSVTSTRATACNNSMNVSEWSGLTNTSPVDVTGTSGNASGTPAPGGSVTTTNPDDLVIGGLSWASSTTTTLTSGSFTALTGQVANQRLAAAYQIVAATGTYQPTWTLSAAGTSGAATAAFKAAAAATSGLPDLVTAYQL